MSEAALVDEDRENGRFRVHRSSMTSTDVLRAELATVFHSSWLYLGHEAEVPEPGDFVRRDVANRPLFLVRGRKTGRLRAFHNTCPHRGAVVCRRDAGTARAFQCFYHAWTFDTEGDLVGVPDEDAYGEQFRRQDFGLQPVARMESYRGFVFVSFDPGVTDLVDYLAGARDYLDLVVDSSLTGWEVVRGSHQYAIEANWKLLVENSIDGYHAASTHSTYFTYLAGLGTDVSGGIEGTAHELGNGHAVVEYSSPYGRPIAKWEPLFGEAARGELGDLRRRLVERFGKDRAHRMADLSRNLFIYPNLIVNDIMALVVRTFMPTSPTSMTVDAWELAARQELPSVRARRLDSFLTFLGPGGFATPDDIEALESCQRGFASGGVEWSDISRGMHRVPHTNDEEQMRAFWRRWGAQVAGVGPESGRVVAAQGEVTGC